MSDAYRMFLDVLHPELAETSGEAAASRVLTEEEVRAAMESEPALRGWANHTPSRRDEAAAIHPSQEGN